MKKAKMKKAEEGKEFVFSGGKKASDLTELFENIENLDYGEFKKYVNTEKNDFANWIEQVLGVKELAKELRKTLSKELTLDMIESFLQEEKENARIYYEDQEEDSMEEKDSRVYLDLERVRNNYPEAVNKDNFKNISELKVPNPKKSYGCEESDGKSFSGENLFGNSDTAENSVKDFIYGILIGLILGIIISRIVYIL